VPVLRRQVRRRLWLVFSGMVWAVAAGCVVAAALLIAVEAMAGR
jgi:hypothetical protein